MYLFILERSCIDVIFVKRFLISCLIWNFICIFILIMFFIVVVIVRYVLFEDVILNFILLIVIIRVKGGKNSLSDLY